MSDRQQRSKYIDDECGCSGEEKDHIDDYTGDDKPNSDDEAFIDNSDLDIDLDDLNYHRQTLHRLHHGDESVAKPPTPPNRSTTLQRSDSDQRHWQQYVAAGIRQYGPDSQPMIIDLDKESSPVTATASDDDIICPNTPPRANPLTTTTTTTTNNRWDDILVNSSNNTKQHYSPPSDIDYAAIHRSIDYINDSPPTQPPTVTVQPPAPVADTPESEPQKGTVESVSKGGKAGRFQLRNKQIGLTYPQCALDKVFVKEALESKCSKYGPCVVVAQENHHKTDGKHLHCYVQLETPLSTRDPHFFDIIINSTTKYTAHIDIVKFVPGWLKYITKADKHPETTLGFSVERLLSAKKEKKATISANIAARIQEGATLRDIRIEQPGFMLLHSRQVTEFYCKLKEDKKVEERKSKWSQVVNFDAPLDQTFTNSRIAGWLNDHLLKTHQFRGINLWIKGPTKCGKTSLVQRLIELGLDVFPVTYDTDFWDGISDDTQLIVFDEFKAQRKITQMNLICDGHNCRLNIKGGFYSLDRPLPVLVLSNFTIKEAYVHSDQEHLTTLEGRFLELEIKQGEHIAITTHTL